MTPTKRVNATREAPRKVASDALLGGQRELVIVHNGREYRLRITQNGKLILTA
jgi:hemin uptake protein HemP